ncbi:hypothetical protein [Tabrizicola sp.]|uniref:hypothetical protein n=1 Tax=Tabrizicola sp. TaxID=2005166 RepID=UPI002FDD4BA3
MRLLISALALLACTATAALPHSEEPLPQIVLTGGEGQMVPDSGVVLLLTKIDDQRCPAEVDCYWEGMIRAEITVTPPKGEPVQIVLCNLCDDGERSATVAGLTLTLMSLAPSMEELAKYARPPLLTDYELTVAYQTLP